jgi:hypothetical protein
MTPSEFRFEILREMYRVQRQRRDDIRASLATPVAALAFSAYVVASLVPLLGPGLAEPAHLAAYALALTAVAALAAAALLIVRVEWRFIYLDPPDLETLVDAERALARDGLDEATRRACMHDYMAGVFDIAYRRYFAENEQRARDRTYGLRLILLALLLLMVAFALLPLAGGRP